jgi:hypothetical protein
MPKNHTPLFVDLTYQNKVFIVSFHSFLLFIICKRLYKIVIDFITIRYSIGFLFITLSSHWYTKNGERWCKFKENLALNGRYLIFILKEMGVSSYFLKTNFFVTQPNKLGKF